MTEITVPSPIATVTLSEHNSVFVKILERDGDGSEILIRAAVMPRTAQRIRAAVEGKQVTGVRA